MRMKSTTHVTWRHLSIVMLSAAVSVTSLHALSVYQFVYIGLLYVRNNSLCTTYNNEPRRLTFNTEDSASPSVASLMCWRPNSCWIIPLRAVLHCNVWCHWSKLYHVGLRPTKSTVNQLNADIIVTHGLHVLTHPAAFFKYYEILY